MPIEIRQHFVAFLDILGFSSMVAEDLNNDNQIYFGKLYKCHQTASTIFRDDPTCSITQFSDSIVIAKPYEKEQFPSFARQVAQYQRLLLDEALLCRGGIAIGKHFSNGSFTFSAGLIEAYRVECKSARYPRVAISTDLLELVLPGIKTLPNYLIEENDGVVFVNYLKITAKRRPATLINTVSTIVNDLTVNPSPSVREKGHWLASYADITLRTNTSKPRFYSRHA